MTLIYTAVTHRDVIQVSDRLLTIAGSGLPHDAESNKTIVVRGPDFAATISYTGVAYIGSAPTDTYLVAQITGMSQEAKGVIGWATPHGFHLRWLISALVSALDKAFTDVPVLQRYSVELAVGSLQSRSPRAALGLGRVLRNGTHPAVWIPTDLTKFRWDREFMIMSVGSSDMGGLEHVRQALRDSTGADPFAESLARGIQYASHRNSAIGADTMSVVLQMPVDRIGLDYRPPTATPFVPASLNYVHTPWLINPGWLVSPSIINGPNTVHISGTEYVIRGPVNKAAPADLVFSLQSQQRKPPPR